VEGFRPPLSKKFYFHFLLPFGGGYNRFSLPRLYKNAPKDEKSVEGL